MTNTTHTAVLIPGFSAFDGATGAKCGRWHVDGRWSTWATSANDAIAQFAECIADALERDAR